MTGSRTMNISDIPKYFSHKGGHRVKEISDIENDMNTLKIGQAILYSRKTFAGYRRTLTRCRAMAAIYNKSSAGNKISITSNSDSNEVIMMKVTV